LTKRERYDIIYLPSRDNREYNRLINPYISRIDIRTKGTIGAINPIIIANRISILSIEYPFLLTVTNKVIIIKRDNIEYKIIYSYSKRTTIKLT